MPQEEITVNFPSSLTHTEILLICDSQLPVKIKMKFSTTKMMPTHPLQGVIIKMQGVIIIMQGVIIIMKHAVTPQTRYVKQQKLIQVRN